MDAADISLGTACNKVVSGARAQAGLMHVFEHNGYTLAMPDPLRKQEIKKWDVETGVDFVAFDPNNRILYLIDAKSDSFEKSEYEYKDFNYYIDDSPSRERERQYLDVAREALEKLKEPGKGIRICHMTIALHNHAMDNLGVLRDNDISDQLIHSIKERQGLE